MADESEPTVTDQDVTRMVEALTNGWTVEAITRVDEGTDFVAELRVETSDGDRTVVLKAATADHVEPTFASAEPRLLEVAAAETAIPVPDVYSYCDDHPDLPAPFVLLEHVEGENYEGRVEELSASARDQIVADAGRHLAALHELGPLPGTGRIGIEAGELAVLGNERPDDSRLWALASAEEALDALESGGYFPELAENPERFADLVPELRSYLGEHLPALPEPEPPTYCHGDYRYGNLLVDPETGETDAVLDWGNVLAVEPAYNLANAESLLVTPDRDGPERTSALRNAFRDAYEAARSDWTLDADGRERLELYLLVCRLDAMACLPLWYPDAVERDRMEREHRRFVREYLDCE